MNKTILFDHYVSCPYKAYLTFKEQAEEKDALEFYFIIQKQNYTSSAIRKISDSQSFSIEKAKDDLFVPIEFSPTNKISTLLKLRLGYQVLESSLPEKRISKYGKIIYGPEYSKTRIGLKKYIGEAKKILSEIRKIEIENNVPIFRLNAHCRLCRYQNNCRKKALQTEDLSLISGLSKKEIIKIHRRGIFTITQLGHSFSPQRRRMKVVTKHLSALKALAIKDNKIYVNKPPILPEATTKLFLDVEV